MATKNGVTLHKRSAVPGKVPLTTDLELGQLGINTNDGKVFIKKDDGAESIVEVGGSSGLEDAPSDSTPYSRQDATWTSTINALSQDTAPQLGGNLDINDSVLSNQTGNDIEINGDLTIFSKDKTSNGGYIKLNVDPGATGGATGFVFQTSTGGLGADTSYLDGNSLRIRSLSKIDYQSFGNDIQFNTGGGNFLVGDISGSSHYTFPPNRGTDGQILVTDNDGNLSWSTPASGGGSFDGTMTANLDMAGFDITDSTQSINVHGKMNVTGGVNEDTALVMLAPDDGFPGVTINNSSGGLALQSRFNEGASTSEIRTPFALQIGAFSPSFDLTSNGNISMYNDTYRFPNTDGTSGQVLSTDGAGNLSWASSSGGGGGFASPATENLDMNEFEIENLSRLTGPEDVTLHSQKFLRLESDWNAIVLDSDLDASGNQISGVTTINGQQNQNLEFRLNQDAETNFRSVQFQVFTESFQGGGEDFWVAFSFFRNDLRLAGDSIRMQGDTPGKKGIISANTLSGFDTLDISAPNLTFNDMIWPNGDGGDGDVLSTDSLGNLYWASAITSLINSWSNSSSQDVHQFKEEILTSNVLIPPNAPNVGDQYYDATLNKPFWWSGTDWLDARGRSR